MICGLAEKEMKGAGLSVAEFKNAFFFSSDANKFKKDKHESLVHLKKKST